MYLTVYSGCMFSGKTDSLIQKVRQLREERQMKSSINHAYIYKPRIDDRYSEDKIETHDGKALTVNDSIPHNDAEKIRRIASWKDKGDVVAIDEAQFFHPDLMEAIDRMLSKGVEVIASALCRDFKNDTFKTAEKLTAKADFLQKKSAICHVCGDVATRTQRINEDGSIASASEPRIKIGGNDSYEARCYHCWQNPSKI